jgi:hypothetical protein
VANSRNSTIKIGEILGFAGKVEGGRVRKSWKKSNAASHKNVKMWLNQYLKSGI